MRLEQAVDRGFRDEVAVLVGEAYCQLAWGQVGFGQCQLEDMATHRLGDAVPDPVRARRPIGQCLRASGLEPLAPAIERRRWNIEVAQRAPHRKMDCSTRR